ncbi:MAG TPA: carbonic anhydrase [Candidatus Polarisedimenticolia bacterium]|nr:carbonic anhydrase [Candidatus Polarisedimenticolia bacterium]
MPAVQTGTELYASTLSWDPTRPPATILCCVDGRWFHHMQEFVQTRLGAGRRTDFLAVPGGVEPLTLFDLIPKDFNFFRRRIQALVKAHGTTRLIAIAHQDCAWYKELKLGPFTLDLRQRQLKDLRRAASKLKDMFPDVAVETYYARLSGEQPPRVVFETV